MVDQTRPKYKLAGLALLIVCVRPGLEMMDASNPDDISDAGKSFDIQELVFCDLGLWLYFWGTHAKLIEIQKEELRPQSVVAPLMRDPSRPGWVATTMVPATWWPHMTHRGALHALQGDHTWPTQGIHMTTKGWAQRDHLGTTLDLDHREKLDSIIPQSRSGDKSISK